MSLDSDVIVNRRRIRRKLTFWRVFAAVVAIAAVVAVNCPTSDHTFTHEVGHVLGGNHDSSTFGSNEPDIQRH